MGSLGKSISGPCGRRRRRRGGRRRRRVVVLAVGKAKGEVEKRAGERSSVGPR